jgi:hypothetical protein
MAQSWLGYLGKHNLLAPKDLAAGQQGVLDTSFVKQ